MNFDSVPILSDLPQRLIPTVDLYLSDLRVRRSQRLSQMLDGLSPLKPNGNLPAFLIPSQKIVQPAMKQKICRAHTDIIFRTSQPLPLPL